MNDNATTTTETATSAAEPVQPQRARSVKEIEGARRKFANLTNGRVTRALLALRVVANIGKLAVSKDQLSEADVERIMAALDAGAIDTRKRLTAGVTGQQLDIEFDLAHPEAGE